MSSDEGKPLAMLSPIGREPRRKPYSIFSSPDGQDCMKKTETMLLRGSIVGSYVAATEMVAFSQPTTPLTILGRFSTVCFPVVAMATAYPAVVCVSSAVRGKKDDILNHFVAGFVSGTILGTRMHSHKVAWSAGIFLGLTGIALKVVADEGLEWIPARPYKMLGGFDQYRRSFVPGQKFRRLELSDTMENGVTPS